MTTQRKPRGSRSELLGQAKGWPDASIGLLGAIFHCRHGNRRSSCGAVASPPSLSTGLASVRTLLYWTRFAACEQRPVPWMHELLSATQDGAQVQIFFMQCPTRTLSDTENWDMLRDAFARPQTYPGSSAVNLPPHIYYRRWQRWKWNHVFNRDDAVASLSRWVQTSGD